MTHMNVRSVLTLALIGAVAIFSASCGGGGGGSTGAGQGLVLLSFSESGVDNVVLNKRLEFRFSEAVDPATINNASIQLREGNAFGLSVFGAYLIQGSTVIFEPQLASLCDQSDSGFKPDTQYRVQLMGFPEEFAVRNSSGQSLDNTRTYEFHTRLESDADKYADQIPGVGPTLATSSPANGDQAVIVAAGNRIEMVLSENVNPCTVSAATVLIDVYEQGVTTRQATAPNGKKSGFSSDGTDSGSTADQLPGNFTTWGSVGTDNFGGTPRRLLCDIRLEQDFNGTKIIATPVFGLANGVAKFPENVLIVVQLTFGVEDFGNIPMAPTSFSFTTENLPLSNSEYVIANDGETAYIGAKTTAAVDPDPRAPSRVQGFMLFAGDGDNGADQLLPSLPNTPASGCTLPRQANDGTADDFAPLADVTLDTGATRNTCPNGTDGSTAVIWEFATLRISNGVTVRIMGVNPALLLVQGDILIDNGGRLLVRGDGAGGTQRGNGATGNNPGLSDLPGGVGVAGGGNGGGCPKTNQGFKYGDDGWAGLGSADYDPTMADGGSGEDGVGAGRAGQPAGQTSTTWDGSSAGGGGAGHATAGEDGELNSGTIGRLMLAPRGDGGGTYERSGNSSDRLQKPEAGSGGGPAGFKNSRPWNTQTNYNSTGGSGGAGGGFLDLTSSGVITILGTLDAAGGRGGNGTSWNNAVPSGGGGGGSGGALRLLTPNEIILSPTTVISTAGGAGGIGPPPQSNRNNANNGGAGGNGRIVFETKDSLVKNLVAANVTPADGAPGFYRGVFDAARFQGGGLSPKALTDLIPVGNHEGFNPTFVEPIAGDFIVAVPVAGSPGIGKTAILIEVSGVQMKADGTADLATQTLFFSVGHFTDNGVEGAPDWNFGHPAIADVPFPADNAGAGMEGFAALNAAAAGDGFEFLQVRFSFYLPSTVGPFDPGALVDDWTIRFTHEN